MTFWMTYWLCSFAFGAAGRGNQGNPLWCSGLNGLPPSCDEVSKSHVAPTHPKESDTGCRPVRPFLGPLLFCTLYF